MTLFTGNGDGGETTVFGCDLSAGEAGQKISKSSAVAEALGSLDETNSFLGLSKINSENFKNIIHEIQENLFIIQAELAGAPKTIEEDKVEKMEDMINRMEGEMPPIKTFFISGGTEEATLLDIARTIARRAERRVVAVVEEGKTKVSPETLRYLNRLSSLLYALSRYSNHLAGVKEEAPEYG